jgi:hypothetical protein
VVVVVMMVVVCRQWVEGEVGDVVYTRHVNMETGEDEDMPNKTSARTRPTLEALGLGRLLEVVLAPQ